MWLLSGHILAYKVVVLFTGLNHRTGPDQTKEAIRDKIVHDCVSQLRDRFNQTHGPRYSGQQRSGSLEDSSQRFYARDLSQHPSTRSSTMAGCRQQFSDYKKDYHSMNCVKTLFHTSRQINISGAWSKIHDYPKLSNLNLIEVGLLL